MSGTKVLNVKSRTTALTMRLPFAMVDQGLNLQQIVAAGGEPWAQGRLLFSAMSMSGPEKRFARGLLTRKRNLWLFRCHQRRFCGDFITVDMSAKKPDHRRVCAIELKRSAELAINGACGIQLRRASEAVRSVGETGIIAQANCFTTVVGDYQAVLSWLLNV